MHNRMNVLTGGPLRHGHVRPLAIALAAFVGLASVSAEAKTLVMATNSVGSAANAMGTAIAKVVTEHSNQRVIVRAFAGPDAYMAKLNDGEYDFAVISAVTAWSEFNRKFGSGPAMKNLRLLRSGAGAINLTFLVKSNSDIHGLKDLKGKRLTSDFGGHDVVNLVMTGALKTAGLDWKDVRPVPVTGVVNGVKALGSGRVDASWGAVGMPVIREVNAQTPVRFLSLIDTPEAKKYYKNDVFPGLRFVNLKPRPGTGITEPTTFMTYDTYLVTNKHTDPKVVKAVLAALWDNTQELQKAHFGLRGFTKDKAVTDLPMIPYHPAAVEFYKEKGSWNGAASQTDQTLLQSKK